MKISELARTPISSAAPAGTDVRYDPLYDALQAEIDVKPSAGSGGTDWNKVVASSSNILETRSKDILVASYLAVGLLQTAGVPQGLLNGINVLSDMIDEYWDNMFPPVKRMRGRVQAFGWWLERTLAYLSSVTDIEPITVATMEELSSAANRLYDLLSEKCPDAPSPRRILDFIKSLPVEEAVQPETNDNSPQTAQMERPDETPIQQTSPPPQSLQQSRPQPQPQSQPQKIDLSFSVTTISNQDEANRVLTSVINNNYLLVDFMLAEPSPQSSWYRLNLLSAWFEIKKLPTATDNKTLIPPPDRQTTTLLASMKGAENWGGVIKSGSYNIRRYPFWLDMNRLVTEALGMMGEKFREAKQAVEYETAGFVKRFAGIDKYTFSDGSPFADNQTLIWLRSLDGGGSAGERPVPSNGDELATKVAEEYSRCRELFNSGKQGEGLSTMQRLLKASTSGRERFLWRLSLLQLLTLSGMGNLATPHISEVMKDYDSHHLEEWDPEMALHSLKTVWNALNSQNDPTSKIKADEIIARISMISPADAFNLSK